MKRLHTLHLIGGLMMIALTSGCVLIESDPPHCSWPRPTVARNVRQFDGVYRNQSLDPYTGKAAKDGTELFWKLTPETKADGTLVEVRSSSTGDVIHLRLLDAKRRQVASADLQRGVDFRLSGGAMILHPELLGWRGHSSRSGPVLSHASFRLHVSGTGGLLGKDSDGGVTLVRGTAPVPFVIIRWKYWPKLPPK